MDLQLWKQLRKALARDCKGRNKLLDTEGKTCAIGCIWLELGLPPEEITYCSLKTTLGDYVTDIVAAKLAVPILSIQKIMSANDSNRTIRRRRAAVLQVWDTLKPKSVS